MLPKSHITLLLALMLPLTLMTSQTSAQTQDCRSNEEYYPECMPCTRSCRNEPHACPEICEPGCGCKPGYLLESSNSALCVHPTQCINCGKLEVYDPCSAHCEDTCDNYLKQNRPCLEYCKPGCRCKKGLVRQNNKCIPKSQCPRKE
ncbi:serine protease inhibitor swm-1-like [Ascaphus truei]|uniref:serine protease inhibitor swm-1-like n=1 Tax=Ascaphus truei TaxID=8439 RepID=UPI003F59294C